MNMELKALLVLILDGIALGKDIFEKNYYSIFTDIIKILNDTPDVLAHLDKINGELAALKGGEQRQDLILFIEAEFHTQIQSDKAQLVLEHSLRLIQNTIACVEDALALKATLES